MSDELQKIRDLCQRFINQEYELEEFYSRLETAIFPENCKDKQHEVLNELEEIRFTKLESNFYQHGARVAYRVLEYLQI